MSSVKEHSNYESNEYSCTKAGNEQGCVFLRKKKHELQYLKSSAGEETT